MKRPLLDLIRCPACMSALALTSVEEVGCEVEAGTLVCREQHHTFPIVRGIPRFVSQSNYADSFGLQWHRFSRTQLDSHSGTPISRNRFHSFTGWSAADLSGRLVLDVGCGAGRFAEVALHAGAEVVAIDYSTAVDACRSNLATHPRLHVVQADVYQLPFEPGRFDFVYCLGVLQHTPDVARAFAALPPQLKPGGRLAVDVYPKLLRNLIWPKYWLRPLTKRMAMDGLFRLVAAVVPVLLPVSIALGRVPLIGRQLRYAVPVCNYDGVLPLTREQLREWAVLDTFDMLAPAHDHPQSLATLRRWFEHAGLRDIEVFRQGFYIGRGRR